MTLRDDVRRHVSRLGLERPYFTDGPSKMQITLASQLMNVVEAAMTDAGVPEPTRRQVLDRVLYGGMPSRAEAEARQQLIDQRRRSTLSDGRPRLGGLTYDPRLQTRMGGGGGAPGGGSGTATGSGGGAGT